MSPGRVGHPRTAKRNPGALSNHNLETARRVHSNTVPFRATGFYLQGKTPSEAREQSRLSALPFIIRVFTLATPLLNHKEKLHTLHSIPPSAENTYRSFALRDFRFSAGALLGRGSARLFAHAFKRGAECPLPVAIQNNKGLSGTADSTPAKRTLPARPPHTYYIKVLHS